MAILFWLSKENGFFSTAHMTFVVNSSSYKVSIYIMCHSGRFAQNVDDNNYHTIILLVIKRQIRSPFNLFSTTLLQTADFLFTEIEFSTIATIVNVLCFSIEM